MKLFFKYLKEKLRILLIFSVFALVFLITFALYRFPIGAVIYPTVLCLIIGIFALLVDFFRVKRRHETLVSLTKMVENLSEMPQSDRIIEGDLCEMVETMKRSSEDFACLSEEKFSEMTDYYTLWAHQIKTPIASMKLTLENLDSELSRKLSSDLFRIEQYVEMVLTYLRLSSDSSDYIFRECPLDPLIKASVKKYARDFIGKKIRLEYEKTDSVAVTDEKWLSFVVEQILSNSLKYTKEGYVRVYVEDPLTLCISDTGIGIAKSDLPRIFEKGYTGFNGRSEKASSGIGLYLCRRICDNLGIDISVSSEIGKGTTVSLDMSKKKYKNE